MFSSHARLAFLISAALLAPPAFSASVHHSTPRSHTSTSHRSSRSKKSLRVRGQQAIQPDRVMQIQQALIREHYFTGEADGQWNSATIGAMQKYQADHGWQTKLMPDSRALKSLGLGPDYSTAINAQGSSFSGPPPPGSAPPSQTAGFVAASGVNQ
jgi:peptidoglycan hydrolase-like protein with peptidoglycan-binding domain